MVLVVFNTLLTLGNKTSFITHQSEQLVLFTSALRMNPKQIFVVAVCFFFFFTCKEHPNTFYVKLEVSHYLSE